MLRAARNILSECVIPVCLLVIVANVCLYYAIRKDAALKRMRIAKLAVNFTEQLHAKPIATEPVMRSTTKTTAASSKDHNEVLTAFNKFGYADMDLMRPLLEPRPLYNFTMIPWKISANESKWDAANNMERPVNWSMIVVVKSHAEHASRRATVRETWGSFEILNGVRQEVVFVVGNGQKSEAAMSLLKENGIYGDILQVDMKEVYAHVGLKTLAGMQWVSQNFPPHWIYSSSDDDMVPNLTNLYKDIEKLMRSSYKWNQVSRKENISGGHENMAVFRPESISKLPIHCGYQLTMHAVPMRGRCKWCINNSTYSLSQYPPYCHGGWYSMPVALASGIYDASRQHQYFRLDDVWITALLRLSYFNMKHYNNYFGLNQSDPSIGIWPVRHGVVGHAGNEVRVRNSWERVQKSILKQSNSYTRRTT